MIFNFINLTNLKAQVTQEWVARYNGSGNRSLATSLAVDGSGNVYVTGYNFVSGPISGTVNDYSTIKYNSSGVQQWIQRYNGPVNSYDAASSLAVDDSGNIYVTGSSTGSATSFDYATIKYSQSVGILQTYNSIPEKFSLSQNYPNPFNPTTNINYELPITNYVSLVVFDMLGNEVATLVNEKQDAGRYSMQFDGSNFASEVYFYRIKAADPSGNSRESFQQTKRMMLIK